MAQVINTGNKTVDEMGEIHISGNVTPMNWYKTILRDNGKPYLLAICILSDIVYWYRPCEIRDENTGLVIGYRKKFKGEVYQKNYQQYADLFGESRRTVKAAMDKLEELGLIKKEFKSIKLSNGMVLNNLMYIHLSAEKLKKITFEVRDKNELNEEDIAFVEEIGSTLPQNNVGTPTETNVSKEQNNVRPDSKNVETEVQNLSKSGTSNEYTNTENPFEISMENKSNQSIIEKYKESEEAISADGIDMIDDMNLTRMLIKDNVNYDYILSDVRPNSKKTLDELIELMVEACVLPQDITIKGNRIPHTLVQSRFEKYDMQTMVYVMDSLNSNHTSIRNYKQYVLTALYNAPLTVSTHNTLSINNDLYGDKQNHTD